MKIKKEFVTKVEIDKEKFTSLKEDDGIFPGLLFAEYYSFFFVATFVNKGDKYYYYRFDIESPIERNVNVIKDLCREYIENDN